MNNQFNNIKKEISKYSFGDNPFIDDAIIKGGYRVVRTVKERNAIDCCHRKLGMRVMVIGQDYSYKDYILKGDDCSNEDWVLIDSGNVVGTVNDSDVTLLDDYSYLDITQSIETQQDLNQVLAEILVSLLSANVVGDKHYTHNQTVPSVMWIINHNLGKKPSIDSVDSTGREIKGHVEYVNENTSYIHHSGPISGKAFCN
mgnify:CR=1 FL=1